MRLLLEAATHMMTRSRLARRIVRRPYYPEARRFFELIAPTYDLEVGAFDRFLAETRDHPPRHRRAPSAEAGQVAASASGAPPEGGPAVSGPPGRRRRRHRGGRRRRRPSGNAINDSTMIVLTEAMSSPNVGNDADVNATESLAAAPSISDDAPPGDRPDGLPEHH